MNWFICKKSAIGLLGAYFWHFLKKIKKISKKFPLMIISPHKKIIRLPRQKRLQVNQFRVKRFVSKKGRVKKIGGYRQWNWYILTIQNKLTNISEVYITFEIWSGLMVTCNKGLFSLRENIHAQDPYCVNINIPVWIDCHCCEEVQPHTPLPWRMSKYQFEWAALPAPSSEASQGRGWCCCWCSRSRLSCSGPWEMLVWPRT